jgi:hypothetical protein
MTVSFFIAPQQSSTHRLQSVLQSALHSALALKMLFMQLDCFVEHRHPKWVELAA